MSEYLETLGARASVGDAFHDLYGKVDATIEKFDALRKANGPTGSANRYVPGTRLCFSWSSGAEMIGRQIGDGWYNSTGLETGIRDSRYSLVSRRKFVPKPGVSAVPSAVSAYRGQEVAADYAIRQEKQGLIEVSLGKFGLFHTTDLGNNEPIGHSKFAPDEMIRRLLVTERQRLVVIADGIMDNIAAAELIGEGQNPEEVIETMGKPVRETAY